MKRVRRIRAAVVALGLTSSLFLAACSSSSEAPGTPTGDDKVVIGYSIATGGQPVLVKAQESFSAMGARYGWETKVLDAQLDAGKQAQDIDQFIAQHVDAIVFIGAGAYETILPAINRAKAAGIKVLGLSAVLDPDDPIAPLDANLDTGGIYGGTEKLAAMAAEMTGGKGNALGVGLGVPVPFLQLMMKQYQEQLAKQAPDMKWLGVVENPTDDITGAEQVVSESLTVNQGDVQVVLAYNDASAIGASVAFKNAGVKGAIIAGQNGDTDAVEAVKDGRITATIDITPWRQGMMSAAMVKGLLGGEEVPAWSSVPVELYTKDNIGDRLDWDEAIAEIKAGELDCKTGGCPSEITALS